MTRSLDVITVLDVRLAAAVADPPARSGLPYGLTATANGSTIPEVAGGR